MLETVWFWLLALMVATYVVLDGFDLGVGILHPFVARTRAQRDATIRSVGPVWDGNEVWLIAAGGTMFMAFPPLLATALSGFYLPFMIMLWLLVFRALAIELRHQFDDPMWRQLWDAALFASSLLLAIIIGAALANVFRGVPLGDEARFFAPLWTDFRVGGAIGVLDWFTILVGLTAAAALTHHGALWLLYKTDGRVHARTADVATPAMIATLLLTLATIAAGPFVRPIEPTSHTGDLIAAILSALSIGALIGTALARRRARTGTAFLASCVYLYATLAAGAAMLYPNLLPAQNPDRSLTIANAAAPANGLTLALYWWVPGMLLVVAYMAIVYRSMPRTISETDDARH